MGDSPYAHQALIPAEELGLGPLQAHCHRGLAILYDTTGWRVQARAVLVIAIALYCAKYMIFWLSQAEAALAVVNCNDSCRKAVEEAYG